MTIESFTPRWRRMLQSIFTGRGGGGGPLVCLDDVMPVVQLFDASQSEHHHTRGEKLWVVAQTVAGGAGTFGALQIINPLASNQLMIIEHCYVSGYSAAVFLTQYIQTTVAAPALPLTALDGRLTPNGFVFGPGGYTNAPLGAAPATPIVNTLSVPIGWGPEVLMQNDADIILQPGQQLVHLVSPANTTAIFVVQGYVRDADPGEISGV